MAKREKETEFPKHVLEVKEALAASNDSRLSMMNTLTEQRDKADKREVARYKKMWNDIFDAETKYTKDIDNDWVYSFLEAAIEASTLPDHAYYTPAKRKKEINNIRLYTKWLEKVYADNGFDRPMITNEGQFYGGFSSYSGGFISFDKAGDNYEEIIDLGRPEKASVNDVLQYFAETFIEELKVYARKGKKAEKYKAIRFIRELASRNIERYTNPQENKKKNNYCLYEVLVTAVNAIYQYDAKDYYDYNGVYDLINKRCRGN